MNDYDVKTNINTKINRDILTDIEKLELKKIKIEILKAIICLLLYVIGFIIIFIFSGWKTGTGLFMVIFSINYCNNKMLKKEKEERKNDDIKLQRNIDNEAILRSNTLKN